MVALHIGDVDFKFEFAIVVRTEISTGEVKQC